MAKGLTFTAIFEAQSLNYDEGFGNLSVLKKLRRGSGDVFTVASRQSLRYSIFTQGVRQFGWQQSFVELSGTGDNKVTQHLSGITESEEVDLFGYMKTGVPIKNEKGEVQEDKTVTITRRMPVRITPAISLEPFFNDVEMLTNKYQSDKIREQPNIANMEQHRSLYRYSVAIDLDRIGNEKDPIGTHISPNTGVKADDELFKQAEAQLRKLEVGPQIRCLRVQQFLEVVKTLHRLIRGRSETLSPLFIIGGVYDCQNPFFMNAVRVEYLKGKPHPVLEPLLQILDSKYVYGTDMNEKVIRDDSFVGAREGYFANSLTDIGKKIFPAKNDIGYDSDHTLSPEGMIDKLRDQVCKCFPKHEHKKTKDNANT